MSVDQATDQKEEEILSLLGVDSFTSLCVTAILQLGNTYGSNAPQVSRQICKMYEGKIVENEIKSFVKRTLKGGTQQKIFLKIGPNYQIRNQEKDENELPKSRGRVMAKTKNESIYQDIPEEIELFNSNTRRNSGNKNSNQFNNSMVLNRDNNNKKIDKKEKTEEIMKNDGWLFNKQSSIFIDQKVRIFLTTTSFFDATVKAFLPASINGNKELFYVEDEFKMKNCLTKSDLTTSLHNYQNQKFEINTSELNSQSHCFYNLAEDYMILKENDKNTINCFTVNGFFLHEFNSCSEAALKIGSLSPFLIKDCCDGLYNQVCNLIFKYDTTMDNLVKNNNELKKGKRMVDIEVIRVLASLSENEFFSIQKKVEVKQGLNVGENMNLTCHSKNDNILLHTFSDIHIAADLFSYPLGLFQTSLNPLKTQNSEYEEKIEFGGFNWGLSSHLGFDLGISELIQSVPLDVVYLMKICQNSTWSKINNKENEDKVKVGVEQNELLPVIKKRNSVIECLSVDGVPIVSFENIYEAAEEVEGIPELIELCCLGLLKQHSGFTWKYKENNENIEINNETEKVEVIEDGNEKRKKLLSNWKKLYPLLKNIPMEGMYAETVLTTAIDSDNENDENENDDNENEEIENEEIENESEKEGEKESNKEESNILASTDREEEEEEQLSNGEEERKKEGWKFDPIENIFIGYRCRRFFPAFGISDATVEAFLPPDKNDSFPLWHLRHDDNDREDVDLIPLLKAMKHFREDKRSDSREDGFKNKNVVKYNRKLLVSTVSGLVLNQNFVDENIEKVLDQIAEEQELKNQGNQEITEKTVGRKKWRKTSKFDFLSATNKFQNLVLQAVMTFVDNNKDGANYRQILNYINDVISPKKSNFEKNLRLCLQILTSANILEKELAHQPENERVYSISERFLTAKKKKLVEEENLEVNFNTEEIFHTPIQCLTITGEVLGFFDDVFDAARSIGLKIESILKICTGKRKSTRRLKFRFLPQDPHTQSVFSQLKDQPTQEWKTIQTEKIKNYAGLQGRGEEDDWSVITDDSNGSGYNMDIEDKVTSSTNILPAKRRVGRPSKEESTVPRVGSKYQIEVPNFNPALATSTSTREPVTSTSTREPVTSTSTRDEEDEDSSGLYWDTGESKRPRDEADLNPLKPSINYTFLNKLSCGGVRVEKGTKEFDLFFSGFLLWAKFLCIRRGSIYPVIMDPEVLNSFGHVCVVFEAEFTLMNRAPESILHELQNGIIPEWLKGEKMELMDSTKVYVYNGREIVTMHLNQFIVEKDDYFLDFLVASDGDIFEGLNKVQENVEIFLRESSKSGGKWSKKEVDLYVEGVQTTSNDLMRMVEECSELRLTRSAKELTDFHYLYYKLNFLSSKKREQKVSMINLFHFSDYLINLKFNNNKNKTKEEELTEFTEFVEKTYIPNFIPPAPLDQPQKRLRIEQMIKKKAIFPLDQQRSSLRRNDSAGSIDEMENQQVSEKQNNYASRYTSSRSTGLTFNSEYFEQMVQDIRSQLMRKPVSEYGNSVGNNNNSNGQKGRKKKPVLQLTMSGEPVAWFESSQTAAALTQCAKNEICLCCLQKKYQHGGFKWEYYRGEPIDFSVGSLPGRVLPSEFQIIPTQRKPGRKRKNPDTSHIEPVGKKFKSNEFNTLIPESNKKKNYFLAILDAFQEKEEMSFEEIESAISTKNHPTIYKTQHLQISLQRLENANFLEFDDEENMYKATEKVSFYMQARKSALEKNQMGKRNSLREKRGKIEKSDSQSSLQSLESEDDFEKLEKSPGSVNLDSSNELESDDNSENELNQFNQYFENSKSKKQIKDKSKPKKDTSSIAVECYTKDRKFLYRFPSITSAWKLLNINYYKIKRVCDYIKETEINGGLLDDKKISVYGLRFEYGDPDNMMENEMSVNDILKNYFDKNETGNKTPGKKRKSYVFDEGFNENEEGENNEQNQENTENGDNDESVYEFSKKSVKEEGSESIEQNVVIEEYSGEDSEEDSEDLASVST